MRRFIILFIMSALTVGMFATVAQSKEGYREKLRREFTRATPVGVGPRVIDNACVNCHAADTMREDYRDIPSQWGQSWHFNNDVYCDDCHGGDKNDASMSMSHQRGFIGTPSDVETPQFCGKCHKGVMDNYYIGGHGTALVSRGEGPTCVTCHGSHNIKKANIDIISETLCSRCHSYERAAEIKKALFQIENKMQEIEDDLEELKDVGVDVRTDQKTFFRIQAEYRSLFHSIDAELIKHRSGDFAEMLDHLEGKINAYYAENKSRSRFTSFLFLIFTGLSVTLYLLINDESK